MKKQFTLLLLLSVIFSLSADEKTTVKEYESSKKMLQEKYRKSVRDSFKPRWLVGGCPVFSRD